MLTIKTPATSANVGPGFDCFGLALSLYNSFDVEISDATQLDNVEERFNNEDNLFVQAYYRGCEEIGVSDHVHAVFHCDIPVSRGLGSSASMITAGLTAASALHGDALSENRIFQLASEMEGHPDNAAPCVFGGMTASMKFGQRFVSHPLELSDTWLFTVLIPDFEVSTEEARAIMPEVYPRNEAAATGAHAVLTSIALSEGNLPLLKLAAVDVLHEPYRKNLIHDFDRIKDIAQKDTDGVFLISGSGSTCLLISKNPLSALAKNEINSGDHAWQIIECEPAGGCAITGGE